MTKELQVLVIYAPVLGTWQVLK